MGLLSSGGTIAHLCDFSPVHGKFNKNNYGLRLLQVGNATMVQALQVGERREGGEALHCALWLRVRGRWARL